MTPEPPLALSSGSQGVQRNSPLNLPTPRCLPLKSHHTKGSALGVAWRADPLPRIPAFDQQPRGLEPRLAAPSTSPHVSQSEKRSVLLRVISVQEAELQVGLRRRPAGAG